GCRRSAGRQASSRGVAGAAGDDRLFASNRTLDALPARRSPPARLLRLVVHNRGFRAVRTSRLLRSSAAPRAREEEFILELRRLSKKTLGKVRSGGHH